MLPRGLASGRKILMRLVTYPHHVVQRPLQAKAAASLTTRCSTIKHCPQNSALTSTGPTVATTKSMNKVAELNFEHHPTTHSTQHGKFSPTLRAVALLRGGQQQEVFRVEDLLVERRERQTSWSKSYIKTLQAHSQFVTQASTVKRASGHQHLPRLPVNMSATRCDRTAEVLYYRTTTN